MSSLQALIFDVDGTIADTERDAHRVAFNRAFQAAGLAWEWSEELYGSLLTVAGGKERIQLYRHTACPEFQPAEEITTWAAALHQAKTKHYRELIAAGNIPLRPGVKRLIQEARQAGIRLAIATTSAPDNVLALLETTLGVESPSWFEVIAAGDIVPAKKPAPDVYHYVLRAMDLTPADCLVLEDSDAGLTAARQAGLPAVITMNGYTQNHDFTGALLVVDHLGEPDQPFQVQSGDVGDATYFDLALARQLLANCER